MSTKIIDSKGRLSLGSQFAGRMVIVDDTDPQRIVVTPAIAIPEKEAWLFENELARKLVAQGLEQAGEGKFSKEALDFTADAALAAELDG